jgi:hypothetical protein
MHTLLIQNVYKRISMEVNCAFCSATARMFGCVLLAVCSVFCARAGESGFAYRGVAFVSFQSDEYLSSDSTDSMQGVRDTGANWVSILSTWYMAGPNANVIAPDPLQTPSDDALRKAIGDAHARGLNVMLKPHVDVADGSFRGLIAPSDTALWFANYRAFILHFAEIAQQTGCELFCAGCELKSMSGAANQGEWTATLNALRGTYTGKLTYAANANFPGDEFSTVSFWAQLDLAGLDVYAPLTNSTAPTVSQLVSAWSNNAFGTNTRAMYAAFAASVGRPVIFTEIGYQSSDGTNITPYGVPSQSLDLQEQADCYSAALTVFSGESWLEGMFWWGWEAAPIDPNTDSHYSPRGKPAESVLRSYYALANRAPISGSGIVATPAAPKPGETVRFSVDAADADGDALSYSWDLGNGLSSADAAPSSVYTNGVYTVKVSVDDGRGGALTETLTLEIFETEQALSAQRCAIGLNFSQSGRDTLSVRGTLPLDSTDDPAAALGANVSVNAGGFQSVLMLDARGRGRSGDRSVNFKLSPRARKGSVAFSFSVRRADLAIFFADENLGGAADVRGEPRAMALEIGTANGFFTTTLALEYSVRANKRGRAKLQR